MNEEISFYEILGSNKHNNRINTDFKSPQLSYKYTGQLMANYQTFFRYVRKLYDSNPGITDEEVDNKVNDLLEKYFEDLSNYCSFRSDSLRLDTAIRFSNDISEFNRVYNELINIEKNTQTIIYPERETSYASNQEVSKRQFLKDLIYCYRVEKMKLMRQYPALRTYETLSESKKKSLKRAIKGSGRSIIEEIEMYLENDEAKGVRLFLDKKIKDLEKELRENYKEAIKQILSDLKEMGVLEKYISAHNKLYSEELGLPELKITAEEFEEAFSEDVLDKLDLTSLASLDSFWINRFSKELPNFNSAYFIISDLNLWEELKNSKINRNTGNVRFSFSKEILEAEFEKMKFLGKIFRNYMYNPTLEKSKGKKNFSGIVDLTSVFTEFCQAIGTNYNEYFSKVNNGAISNSQNDFEEDFPKYYKSINTELISYKLKDYIMIAQLSELFTIKNFSKNWGVTYEDCQKGLKRNMMLLDIDIPGLNMPQRLHISRYCLEDFLMANQNSSRIPIYQGENDFKKSDLTSFPTPILLPLLPQRKKAIINLSKKVDTTHPRYKFIQHLAFIAGGPVPEHLKSSEPNSSKKRLIHRIYDLSDGKIYKKTPDQNYVEDTDFLEHKKSEQR